MTGMSGGGAPGGPGTERGPDHDGGQAGEDAAARPAGPAGVGFCSGCGGALASHRRGDRWRWRCTTCGRLTFHNPAVGVAVVVRDEQGRVLLGRRNRTYPGRWCIPCGYVEWDEDVREAAVCELEEETGLVVTLGPVLAVHSNVHDPNQHTVGIWFEAATVTGTPTAADDLDEVAFWPPGDPPPLAFPTDELVLAELAEADQRGDGRSASRSRA
jgi:8-oxo-dGTP diphosphatase